MEVINRRCAGLDVHLKSVSVCRRTIDEHGEFREEVRTFGTTMTVDTQGGAILLATAEADPTSVNVALG